MPEARLQADNGFVVGDNGKRIGYGELVAQRLHVNAGASSNLTPPQSYRYIGKSLPRVDIPAKVSGGAAYVHDMRLPGMVHARVVRPPSYGARLQEIDTTKVEHMPGVVKVVRDGSRSRFRGTASQGHERHWKPGGLGGCDSRGRCGSRRRPA